MSWIAESLCRAPRALTVIAVTLREAALGALAAAQGSESNSADW